MIKVMMLKRRKKKTNVNKFLELWKGNAENVFPFFLV